MERKRTSKKQFKIYIDYIKSHKILLTGKWSPSNNPEDMEALWRNLTQELNSCGDGPIRDTNGWKKVFTEWKGVCRKKARESKALSELEAEIIKLTGQGAVTGLDLGELGLNPSCSSTKTTTKQPGTSYTLVSTVHSEEREQSDEETKPASSPENQPSTSKGTVKNKRSKLRRTRTGDILCQTYENAVNILGGKLFDISLAILEVANAINRYCDIVENNIENTVIIDQE
ncbi:uncharacterized protein isoform X3 [Leptinotarsa decemlineata]|uniref:uncharacterized protein isoform X3 n=1 Tax=Leptinotarsa decemlineata TaxID=7539 RepID=UPI003D30D7C5